MDTIETADCCCTDYLLHRLPAAQTTCCTDYLLHRLPAAQTFCCTDYLLHRLPAAHSIQIFIPYPNNTTTSTVAATK